MVKKKQLQGHILKPAGLIDQMASRVEAVKSKSSIVEVFRHYGVDLKGRPNGEYTGLCPFHDDHTPSLCVNEDKKVFNCPACGKKGNIFHLVQEKEGIDFNEALKWLERFNGAKQFFTEKKEVNDQPLKVDLPAFSLKDIVEHYQKCLNDKPLGYLKSRGFSDLQLINRFKIGFSDGSLIEKLSDSQQETLAKTGLLKKSKVDGAGHSASLHCSPMQPVYFEAFRDHIVFPIIDENGQVVELYGRSIAGKSKYPHLYQTGGHKGIFNYKATKVYDEIILTESIIDALSLIQLGLSNTTACFGTNGFTDHHLKAFKEGNVKTVIIAFDNDEAGKKASEKLKDQLLPEGFEVKIIFPPSVSSDKMGANLCYKDWNEALVNGISKDEIEKLIIESEIFMKEEEKKDFIHRKENKLDIFILGGITYKLAGVKEIFVTNLKVNITAEIPGDFFVDSVDLCSYRSRMTFSNNLSERFAVEPKRIENHLLKILKFLEEQRQKILDPDQETTELTEEEKEAGLTFLKNPTLFDLIVEDMTTLGYVGEDLNKQLIYLCASSRKLDDPINVLIVSQSASGKSYLTDTVKKLIPPDEVLSVTSLSDQALNYIENLTHKFLVFGEAIHNETIEHHIREMLSSKELSRLVTLKDEKTGNMVSKVIKKEVIVASVMSTTSNSINPENASRYFLVGADETEAQTKRIHQMQKAKYSKDRFLTKKNEVPQIVAKHRAAQKLLKKLSIIFPKSISDKLDFPAVNMRTRRDHDRFIDLIASVCFLRQYQKEVKVFEDGSEYIECDKTDYSLAYQIIKNILPSTLFDLSASTIRLYDEIRGLVKKKSEAEVLNPIDVTFTQREVREYTSFSGEFIKKHIRLLVDYEYLQTPGSKARGARKSYKLVADEEIKNIDLSVIPAPDKL